MNNNIPAPQQIYRHFKGGLYQIVTLAEHTETGEQLVIYQALYGDFRVYARPLSMFTSRVDREKYPDVLQEYRFEPVYPASFKKPEEACGGAVAEEASSEAKAPEEPSNAKLPEESSEAKASEEPGLDPLVLEFLDSDSYEQRLNILAALHHRITDEMITTMAIASDIEVEGKSVEERYEGLKRCLLTLEKYECHRLR